MAYISDNELLNLERVRAKLRNNLRAKGIECSDNEQIDSLATKASNIKSTSDILSGDISGDVYYNGESIRDYAFKDCKKIRSIKCPELKAIPVCCFLNCIQLQKINVEKATSLLSASISQHNAFCALNSLIELNLFKLMLNMAGGYYPLISASVLKRLNISRFTGVFGNTAINTSNNLEIMELGLDFSNNYNYASNKLRHLILRRPLSPDSPATLSASSYITKYTKFASGGSGGIIFAPRNSFDYTTLTNWSACNFIQKDIEGSRYEEENWLSFDREWFECFVDNQSIGEVPKDETVDVFKYTENFTHIYCDGVELQDDEIIGDYQGELLTTTI